MPSSSGSPTQNRTSVATPAELAGVPDDAFDSGDTAYVDSLAPNGLFYLDRASVLAPDNVQTISTFTGNGRWRVLGSAVSGAVVSVSTVAELGAYADAGLPNGALAWVASLRTLWELRREAVVVGNGITIEPAASGTANWYRSTEAHFTWVQQLTWFIDPVGGDDENTGAAANVAIQTFAELQRRFYGRELSGIYTINVLDDVPVGSDPVRFTDFTMGQGAEMNVIGVRTVIGSGSIAAVTAINRAANQLMQITSADVTGGWAANLRKIVRINAGARLGAFAFVLADLGAGVAQVSAFATVATPSSSPALVTPVAGDTFDVIDVSELGAYPTIDVGVGTVYTGRFTFNDFHVPKFTTSVSVGLRSSSVRLNGCVVEYILTIGVTNTICGNSLVGGGLSQENAYVQFRAGALDGLLNADAGHMQVLDQTDCRLQTDMVISNGARFTIGMTTGSNAVLSVGNAGLYLAGAAGQVMVLLGGARVYLTAADSMYGAAANNISGFRMHAGTWTTYSGAGAASTAPNFTTAGAGVNVDFGGGVTMTFAAIEAAVNVAQANNAAWYFDV